MLNETKPLREVKQTLNIVRYTTEELKEFITNEFYKNLATETKMYFMESKQEQNAIRPRVRFELRKQRIKDIEFRIKDYEKRRAKEKLQEDKNVYTDGIGFLMDKLALENNYCIKTQKAEYEATGDVYASHSYTEFPLNKKINALYDEFNAVVLYYDDLTNEEIISKLENAPTLEEKIQIVKDNVEITHIFLSVNNSARATIAIMGKLDKNYSDIKNGSAIILPSKFSDFSSITLQECEEIKNNDLAQLVQERIDMDKENLIVEHSAIIKGEEYTILKSPYTGKEYIRYTCPSTQRVYYNVLDFNYLSTSKYYKENQPSTYALAWCHIANLFLDLTEEEIKKPSIAC